MVEKGVSLKIKHYFVHVVCGLVITSICFVAHVVFGGGSVSSNPTQGVGVNGTASSSTNDCSITNYIKINSQSVNTNGTQRYVNQDGTKTLVLNWGNRTFAKSVRVESVRVGSGTESADRVEMASAAAGGVSSLGESAAAKKTRVRNNEGIFSQEEDVLMLVVTEGFCPEGKISKLRFCDNGQTLIGTNIAEKLCLEINTQK